MARAKTVYECATCGEQVPKWVGRCSGCGNWNTLVESVIGGAAPGSSPAADERHIATHRPAVPLCDLDGQDCAPQETGVAEFDRVLGGGILAYFVLTRGMEIPWRASPLDFVQAVLVTMALAIVAGLLASVSALEKRPVEVLRSTGE